MFQCDVILVEPEFEESIGFVARSMKNFGLRQLKVVNPIAKLSDYGRMRAGHAQEILDNISSHSSLKDALDETDLSVGTTAQISHFSANLLRRPVTPKELATVVRSTEGKITLVFGREGTGLNNIELGICDVTMTIPTSEKYRTLNISHAAAIVFYELFQAREEWIGEAMANEPTKQKILQLCSQLAFSAGLKEHKVGIALKTLRNIMGRSAIRRREASVLAGLLRRISEHKTASVP